MQKQAMQLKKNKLSKIFTKSFLVYSVFALFIILQMYFFIPSIKNNQWISSKSAEQIKELKNQSQKKSIEQKMKGIHLLENDQQKKGWELFSEEATGSKDEQWLLKKVKVKFYADEISSFTVTGDVGEVDGQNKDMTIRGNVITESSNGYTFETSELKYQAIQKKLFSSDLVNMKSPADKNGSGLVLTGMGLEIFVAESKIRILNQVEARKIVDGKKFKLNANSSVFSSRDREATFMGSVKINFDTMKLSAPFADFKYKNKKDILEIVRLYDQVEFIDNNRRGKCSELIVNQVEGTMTMNGSPQVKMDQDEIQGEQIVFSDNGKKVKINRMKLERK